MLRVARKTGEQITVSTANPRSVKRKQDEVYLEANPTEL
jgi:hypothetical protein